MFKLKTMIGFYILTIGLGLTLASCEEDDPQPESNTHQDAFGDVFVKKVKTPLGDRYGLIFYAGGQGLITATATEPDNAAYNLAEYWKGPGNMRRHPADNEMQATMPQSGGISLRLLLKMVKPKPSPIPLRMWKSPQWPVQPLIMTRKQKKLQLTGTPLKALITIW